MAYRKINYTPETLERRKEYQRKYARARRRTPEGEKAQRVGWAKHAAKIPVDEQRAASREATFKYRARKLGVCAKAARTLIEAGCSICGKKQDGIKSRRTLVLDHDHKTGLFRGVLCTGCNTGIGRFRDDPEMLERALRYLRREL